MKKIIVIYIALLAVIFFLTTTNGMAQTVSRFQEISLTLSYPALNSQDFIISTIGDFNLQDTDLNLSLTDDPDPILVGSILTYQIIVTNEGPDWATWIVLTDILPSEATFYNAPDYCVHDSGIVTCDLGNYGPGGYILFHIFVIVPDVEEVITNTATVTANEFDPDPLDNTAIQETSVIYMSDLAINLSDSPDPVAMGSVLTYTLSINNPGPNDATGVIVTDTLDASVAINNVSVGCIELNGLVTCNVGDIAVGSAYTITITVIPLNIGIINNTASVTGNVHDPNPSNNIGSVETTVLTSADLRITSMTDIPDPVLTGNYLSYYIQVYNAGPGYATEIFVDDTLPIGVIFVSDQDCNYDANQNKVICYTDSLVSHGSKEFSFIVITPNVEGIITNTAYVTGMVIDPFPNNNYASEITHVVHELNLNIYLPIVTR